MTPLPRTTRVSIAPTAATSTGRTNRLGCAVRTDTGPVRERNEDCARHVIGDADADGECSLLIVADGMGGHQGGEVASLMATEGLAQAFRAGLRQAPQQWLDAAFRTANRHIVEAAQADARLDGMGTTLTALLIQHGRFQVAHVGDSRAYLLRSGRWQQLTTDDTLVNDLLRRGELTPEQARQHPDRNLLVRAMGSARELEGPVLATEGVLLPGDRFLLCTDGLHDVVGDTQLQQLMSGPSLHAVAESLIAAALCGGASDNITVAVLAVEPEGPTSTSPQETRQTRPRIVAG